MKNHLSLLVQHIFIYVKHGRKRNTISEFGVATAHSNDAFCVGIKISITIHSIEMEIFIPTQNASFECAVETPTSLILGNKKCGSEYYSENGTGFTGLYSSISKGTIGR